jgi:hypothetical protein
MTKNQQAVPSEWVPLQIATFRAIWFASLAANVGTWVQNVKGRVAHDEGHRISALTRNKTM